MIYGQSCMIDPKTAAAIPLPTIEEETFKRGHVQSHTTEARQSHTADFYTHCLGLYDILYDVLLHSHSSKSPRQSENGGLYSENFSPFQANTLIVEIEERLSKWESRLPNYYKTGSKPAYSNINGLLVRRRVILHQRYVCKHAHCVSQAKKSLKTSSRAPIVVETYAPKFHYHRASKQGKPFAGWKLALLPDLSAVCNRMRESSSRSY